MVTIASTALFQEIEHFRFRFDFAYFLMSPSTENKIGKFLKHTMYTMIIYHYAKKSPILNTKAKLRFANTSENTSNSSSIAEDTHKFQSSCEKCLYPNKVQHTVAIPMLIGRVISRLKMQLNENKNIKVSNRNERKVFNVM